MSKDFRISHKIPICTGDILKNVSCREEKTMFDCVGIFYL